MNNVDKTFNSTVSSGKITCRYLEYRVSFFFSYVYIDYLYTEQKKKVNIFKN